ncbi:MAG: hypothetical protein JNK85_00120 [Verrucomicrobiales bacterium]|nr:hypothetical protein [Verrucomicrobiales bacterium]
MNDTFTPGTPVIPARRDFIAAAARAAAAVALVGVTGFAIVPKGGNACRKVPICGQCPIFEGCGLPRAEEWRGQEKGRDV